MRRLGLLVFASLLTAGCAAGSDRPPAPDPAPTNPTTGAIGAQAAAPEWNLRQGWTYNVEIPGEPTHTFQMMVAEERPDLWVVASSNRTQAVHHAVYSFNPVLGRINKTTLSPFQGGSPVEMYRFPLLDKKTWTARFFGETMTFTATYVGDIDTSGVNANRGLGARSTGFRIVAEGPTKKVLYDYLPSAEWFTSFEVLKQGQREVKLLLKDILPSYSGTYFFWRGKDVLDALETHQASEAPTTKTLDAAVPSDFKDRVAIGVRYLGQSGTTPPSAKLTLAKPDGSVAWTRTLSGAGQEDTLADVAGGEGTWKVTVELVGTSSAEIRVAGLRNFAEGRL